jgi:hypothetical protein
MAINIAGRLFVGAHPVRDAYEAISPNLPIAHIAAAAVHRHTPQTTTAPRGAVIVCNLENQIRPA